MLTNLWGVANDVGLLAPSSVAGYGLILVYLLSLLALFNHFRNGLRLVREKWWQVAALCLMALLLSQLFPLQVPAFATIFPNLVTRNYLTLLAPLPYLLAGVLFNPAIALLVGLFGGLGRALGESHQFYDIFHVAFAAGLGSVLMRQRYAGRQYQWLRQPVVAGVLAQSSMVIGIGLAAAAGLAAASAATGILAALDLGMVAAWGYLPSLVVEGLFAGIVITMILLIMPQWRPDPLRVPPPAQRNLDQNLLGNFAGFALVLVLLSVGAVFFLFSRAATTRLVEQMAFNTETIATTVPELTENLENVLAQYGGESPPVGETAEKRELARLMSLSPLFDAILLVRPDRGWVANSDSAAELTVAERAAIDETLETNFPSMATAADNSNALSIVTPVQDGNSPPNVLVGRVAFSTVDDVIARLANTGQGDSASGSGALVDQNGQLLLSAGTGIPPGWAPPADLLPLPQPANAPGLAFQYLHPVTNERMLGYYAPVIGEGWLVVMTIPAAVVLGQSLAIVAPVAFLLFLVAGLFYFRFDRFGRNLSRPIARLIDVSKEMTAAAAASMPVASTIETVEHDERADEIGQLNVAFAQMQRALKQRLDDLTLLLNVSHEVAAAINIDQGMPAILQGSLRGTGAAASRAVVRNPNNPYPLIFTEGPAAESLSVLDRVIMRHIRQVDELALSRPEEICRALEIPTSPIAALFAVPLRSQAKFQGVLYLGYRQPHYFDQTERNLLHTLAGQAAVLVENAHLYAMAEGGRRRLAAILASTSDAIVVTDQTDRVLYLNAAMENAFKLSAADAVGRPVADVSLPPELVRLLSMVEERPARLELALGDRTFLADASTIVDRNGAVLGRVAVLYDVTHFKEVDRLKSEFLTGVSHDLRSPLTVMQNNATSLLLLDNLPERSRDRVKKIQTSIDQMVAMVDDVLALARIEAGVDFEYDDVRIERVLREAAVEQSPRAKQEGIELAVEVRPELPLVRADHHLVKRAVTNLLLNGIKYAPNSGRMTLRAEPRNGELVISIRDNGPGITSEEQLRLFEKFYRAERPGIRRVKGSGLGLAIVKSIAEQHGGRAWCHSQPGQGSTFYIALPLTQAPVSTSQFHEARR